MDFDEAKTSIGSYAFSGCTSIKEIVLSDDITSLGTYAFNGCTSLESVKIGNGIKTISERAFYGCTNLTNVQMGSSIPCGELNEVVDDELKDIRLPKEITGDGEFFLLKANGNSMIKAGIDNGDLVLIKKQSHEPSNGKIVAFLYDGDQTTLKRYRREKDAIYLCPENDTMQPIVIKGQDRTKLRIQGVAVRVIKELN